MCWSRLGLEPVNTFEVIYAGACSAECCSVSAAATFACRDVVASSKCSHIHAGIFFALECSADLLGQVMPSRLKSFFTRLKLSLQNSRISNGLKGDGQSSYFFGPNRCSHLGILAFFIKRLTLFFIFLYFFVHGRTPRMFSPTQTL